MLGIRQIFKFLTIILLAAPLGGQTLSRTQLKSYVWEYPLNGFSETDYDYAVESLIAHWEMTSGKTLAPGEKRLVGIKVFTQAGPGLMTPHALTLAVIKSLEKRGFTRSMMFITDTGEARLRECGYLPSRRGMGGEDFGGVPVYSLDETPGMVSDTWFYDSNLPSRERMARAIARGEGFSFEENPNDRKSFLTQKLFMDTDFWINLPMVQGNDALGVSGALANASLWNITNNQRFFQSPANAPVAAAEISAIPELSEKWVFTILSLERYQFQGGPRFNALYTEREKKLWLSTNPVALDYLMYRRIERNLKAGGFKTPESTPPLFEYASTLGLGPYEMNQLKLRRLAPAE